MKGRPIKKLTALIYPNKSMNKKQIISLWLILILIVFLLGSKTTTVYRLSEVYKPNGPEIGQTALMLYGSLILTSQNAGNFYFLLNIGEYKWELIIASVMIGCGLFYSLRSKKLNL